jgi:hypothetical protein
VLSSLSTSSTGTSQIDVAIFTPERFQGPEIFKWENIIRGKQVGMSRNEEMPRPIKLNSKTLRWLTL